MQIKSMTGRATFKAQAGEVPIMLRSMAAALNTTPHPIRSLRVAVDANGVSYGSIKWLWWESAPLASYISPQRRTKAGRYHLSVPYRNQLGYVFDEAAAWIEAHGASEVELYQDELSGWWVLTIV